MRIPCHFLLAAAAVALGGAFPAAATAATAAAATAAVATVRSGAPSATIGSLLASLPDPKGRVNDFDGNSVAVSGNLAAVGNGGPAVDGQHGVVYLYQRKASGWPTKPKAALHDPQHIHHSGFGWGLAAFGGTTVAVGAAYGGTTGGGAVYIYTKTASGWPATPTVTLQDPEATSGDLFGWSVAVSKDAIVVGSPGSIDGGTEYIYFASNGTWPTTPSVISPNPDRSGCAGYGSSVAISASGSTAVIGCPGFSTTSSLAFIEHVSPINRNTFIARTLPDPAATPGDFFGRSVAVSGNNIVIGTLAFTGPENVYIYTKTASGWPSVPTVTIPDPGGSPGDDFGATVSISGPVIAVGDNGPEVAYLYGMVDGAWLPAPEATVPDPGPDPAEDSFGQDVSVSGATLIVGAPDTNNGAGAAYLFSS